MILLYKLPEGNIKAWYKWYVYSETGSSCKAEIELVAM